MKITFSFTPNVESSHNYFVILPLIKYTWRRIPRKVIFKRHSWMGRQQFPGELNRWGNKLYQLILHINWMDDPDVSRVSKTLVVSKNEQIAMHDKDILDFSLDDTWLMKHSHFHPHHDKCQILCIIIPYAIPIRLLDDMQSNTFLLWKVNMLLLANKLLRVLRGTNVLIYWCHCRVQHLRYHMGNCLHYLAVLIVYNII